LAIPAKTESKEKNHKDANVELGMTQDMLEEAERIIREMNCYYYCLLGTEVE
jgi:hypothetical protein